MSILILYDIELRLLATGRCLKSVARRAGLQHGIDMTLIERTEESETIGDDGYRRIRADIVLGRLRPGQKLKLDGLKESYGVSVSTLREILSRLTSEGLVLAEGRRGFEVAPVSVDNLKELAELRLLLEGHAMEASFAHADMEWEGRVVSAHHKLAATERLMSSNIGEPEQWKRYDSEFHQRADLELRLARADGSARGGVRQIFPLSDDRAELSRRGAGAAASGAARMRAGPRFSAGEVGPRGSRYRMRGACAGDRHAALVSGEPVQ